MNQTLTQYLADEAATQTWAKRLAQLAKAPLVIYLNGPLGAGKTALSRGFIQALGHAGAVKSPTYTLVEPYDLGDIAVYHFDLYRLADPEELEFMGIRDYFSQRSMSLIEWPERGEGWLPKADIVINVAYENEGRQLECIAHTPIGEHIVKQLK
ncbi:MAG TPA: tRNA (adenosine(37)-N6)-threonylcarbamoyltransferase complex ATPase subunit type 1 TsaE [Idiomarina sp.]|jgi:tRNA threonylcarbamoyladenosine biosynthesis protein TsaE|uniref:tRNA (adenosine(37)-N6)-threonylcarbamoyltransferase complex ATPase subunit type 1 TsaE n=1 Tax=Idiomarina TaxID=135575 RepID=UPI000C362BFC|nr:MULTISPECIES: tRNA (adenosine(37)-N6)-threonylcarbamoyltransferase complex ATPase subunit type 1 TsaE [Idiomarina]MBR37954.1 tRNA (adenosine(37)-N6)-threonylcarbamoyltransferase complex ATPase subunit type 1 TsaE [Idiomarina sp.]HAE90714.1 tRNA (adenosine(37)-N6)-threonylcarbamoyltransferase complex ATPase subunit type 1 TsaE [Idiomarina sp.]|tara:strand:+ start:161 stop:622 length:462 start_codon:yes stop_codon:yes gene_type:complete